KKRHNKRRLVQPPLIALAARKLVPGGYMHLATDWEPYAEHMLIVLAAEPLLKNSATGYAPRPAWRPQTKFETRGLRLGHGVRDGLGRADGAAPGGHGIVLARRLGGVGRRAGVGEAVLAVGTGAHPGEVANCQ